MADRERIVVSEDGLSLPVIEVLTGRGAIFGKSGSGKSNTASVVVEELLEKGFPVLVVDIEGEYETLSERYDVITVGDGDQYDYPLFEIDPGDVVDFCLDQHRPVVIDISAVLEIERAERVITDVLQLLFSREKRENKPFLVLVEEIHEFLPQQGGLDDLGDMLIRIAKRGRKRGVGLLGMSQRPASVDKNFITQCDWLVFHRLTWENDTRVVKSILGSDYAEDVKDLGTGSAYLLADWEEAVRQVQFRRKKTQDAGDTPSLEASQRRDLTASPEQSAPTQSSESVPEEPQDGGGEPTAAGEEDHGEDRRSDPSDDPSTDDVGPPEGEAGPTEAAVEPIEADPPTVEPESSPQSAAIEQSTTHSPTEAGSEQSSVERAPLAEDAEDRPDDPTAKALWELGHFVTFALARAIGGATYALRLGYARLMGHSKPADRLGPLPVEDGSGRPGPSQFAVRILAVLLGTIALLVLVAWLST